ncbi:unnamed protein product [Adineta steineri]|uniref:Nuclear receptor domain-containing protein n=1 Tax=Adineta steineri TaxID=433720 RepID=A0A815PHD3_9BILA|nr:unnamed protein product [Adineta steineri]
MSSKRRLSASQSSKSPQEIDGDSNVNKSESSFRSDICLVCGDTARIINYGALSCLSCRTFFRRNGFRPDGLRPCTFNKCCEINMQTRHTCTACRLEKCFTIGMSSDLIRKEDTKKLKCTSSMKQSSTTDQSTSQQVTTAPQLVTSNILHSDQSSHIDSQRTLLSNILHSHDIFSTMSQMLLTVNNSPALSVETHSNVINPIEIINQMFISMQSFISSSPDFRVLTVSEQTSLFERNLPGVVTFYSTLFFRHTGILRIPEYLNAFITIYGSDIMLSLRHTIEQLDPDPTLIKIILIILAFSSNCLIVNTNKTMERDSLLDGILYTSFVLDNQIQSEVPRSDERIRNWQLQMKKACTVEELRGYYCKSDDMKLFQSCQEKMLQSLAKQYDTRNYDTFLQNWIYTFYTFNKRIAKEFPKSN